MELIDLIIKWTGRAFVILFALTAFICVAAVILGQIRRVFKAIFNLKGLKISKYNILPTGAAHIGTVLVVKKSFNKSYNGVVVSTNNDFFDVVDTSDENSRYRYFHKDNKRIFKIVYNGRA